MSFDLSWVTEIAQSLFSLISNAINALAQYFPVLIPMGIVMGIILLFRDTIFDLIRSFLPF